MKNLTEKIIIGFLAFSVVFFGTAIVFADEREEIRQEMEEIREMLQAIASQVSGDVDENGEGVTGIEGVPENFAFNQNLRQGSRGLDVKYLQIVLNANPDTRLASTGPGSPGNETEYFGPITLSAVHKFQTKYNSEVLVPAGASASTGFVGTYTRAKLNEILSEGAPVPSPIIGEEIMEKLKEIATKIEALAKRIEDLEDRNNDNGEEGDLSLSRLSVPRNVNVGPDQEKYVAGLEAKAEDSSITINRIDLKIVGDTLTRTEIANKIEAIGFYIDDDLVGEREVTRDTIDRTNHDIRFSNLDISVPKGEAVDVMIKVTASDFTGDGEHTIQLSIEDRGLRYTDSAGITGYTQVDLRSFRLVERAMAEVEISLSKDTPQAGMIHVESVDEDGKRTTGVEILRFEIEVEEEEVEIVNFMVLINLDGVDEDGRDFDDLLSDISLYHEGDLVDSMTKEETLENKTYEILFSDVAWVLEVGAHEFSVEIDIEAIESGDEGASIKAIIPEQGSGTWNDNQPHVIEELYDYKVLKYPDLNGEAEGEEMKVYSYFPENNYKGSDVKRVTWSDGTKDRVEGYIEFEVTAHGGDAYFIGGDEVYSDTNNIKAFGEFNTAFSLSWVDVTSNATSQKKDLVLDEGDNGKLIASLAGEYTFDEDGGSNDAGDLNTELRAEGYQTGEYVEVTITNSSLMNSGIYRVVSAGSEAEYKTDYISFEALLYRVREGRTETFKVEFATENEKKRDRIRISEINWMNEDEYWGTLSEADGNFEDLETSRIETFQD